MKKKTLETAVEELSLMLMYLTRFSDYHELSRFTELTWKGYNFGMLDLLEEKNCIYQPRKRKYAVLTEKGKERARELLESYHLPDLELYEQFEFRNIRPEEASQAADIEQICFPPNEACSREKIAERVAEAPDFFLTAVDRTTGKLAGFLNGVCTDECIFRDEFFTDISLHNPDGKNIMLLGLDVLPQYRGHGLAREIMYSYLRTASEKMKQAVILTCLPDKVKMYKKMGFSDRGIASSNWGGEQWHEMICIVNWEVEENFDEDE